MQFNSPTQVGEVDDADTPGVVQLIKRVLQPALLGDFVALALTLGFSIRGSQSNVTTFLGGQVRRCPPGGIDFEP